MKAIQYTAFGTHPKLVEIDKPAPGPGEVLLKDHGLGTMSFR